MAPNKNTKAGFEAIFIAALFITAFVRGELLGLLFFLMLVAFIYVLCKNNSSKTEKWQNKTNENIQLPHLVQAEPKEITQLPPLVLAEPKITSKIQVHHSGKTKKVYFNIKQGLQATKKQWRLHKKKIKIKQEINLQKQIEMKNTQQPSKLRNVNK